MVSRRSDLLNEGLFVGNAPMGALRLNEAQSSNSARLRPTCVLGRVVPLGALDEPPWPRNGKAW